MRAAWATAAALFVSACAFWSERPLFDESEAAAPFADGARFEWRENGEDVGEEVAYRLVGKSYELQAGGDQPMRVTFIPLTQTPEEDFIAQVTLPADENARAYAFMWRCGDGFRIIAAPRALGAGSPRREAADALCSARPNGECRLDRREDLLTLYLTIVHPAYVAGAETPEDFMDQLPIAPEGK